MLRDLTYIAITEVEIKGVLSDFINRSKQLKETVKHCGDIRH
jgi:hypothetical protein